MTNDTSEDTNTIKQMFAELGAASPIYRPSAFWQRLNAVNSEQLARRGYNDFKRTINQNYFNFLVTSPRNEQFRQLFAWWLKHPTLRIFTAQFNGDITLERRDGQVKLSPARAFVYKLFIATLWEYTSKHDPEGLLERLGEPQEGNPLPIKYRGKQISQDLCNSVLKYYSAVSCSSLETEKQPVIAELGGGYGRTAYVFLKARPCRYVLIDIPPALYVCQRYLSAVLPNKKLFRFRHFNTYEEIREEYERADICILTPNQLELLPKDSVDLFLNISSFGEMTLKQIDHYIHLIDSCCRGGFYTKQWQDSVNTPDDIVISVDDYRIPPHWIRLFSRQHPIQAKFFEALYRIGTRYPMVSATN